MNFNFEPNERGYWGKFGGRFVPETLVSPLEELTDAIRNVVREELSKVSPEDLQPPQDLLTEKEVLKKLGITQPTISKWRQKGKIPFVRVGSSIRYDLGKVIKALEGK